MNRKRENIFIQYFITFIVSIGVVFALCFCVELELLFRCENNVSIKELAVDNMSKFFTIEQLEHQLKKDPKSYVTNIRLASVYEELGEFDKANEYYLNALNISSRSNFALYRYALFCARNNLFALSTTYAEELNGANDKIYRYKANVYEAIADGFFKDSQYLAATKAYQISYKYARSIKNYKNLNIIKEKYADAYISLADTYVEQGRVKEAISALKNSLKINETSIAKYKLALIYQNFDKIQAERYMFDVFSNDPYIVNPYIYNKLLSDLVSESTSQYNDKNANYYSMKLNRLNKKLKNFYVYKDDVIVENTRITSEKKKFLSNKKYFIVFNIKNNTKIKLSQLYIMVEIYKGSKKYIVHKKVIRNSNALNFYEEMKNANIKLPNDFDVDFLNKNACVVKYYAKKSMSAPWTLLKIESVY